MRGRNIASVQDLPAEVHDILMQWVTRFHCLRRLRLLQILAEEAQIVLNLLPTAFAGSSRQPSKPYFVKYIPFQLLLFKATLPVNFNGDLQDVLADLQDLVIGCKHELRRTQESLWKDNLRTATMAAASVLVQMDAWSQAYRMLQTLAKLDDSDELLQAIVLLQLEIGDVSAAEATLTKSTAMTDEMRGQLQFAVDMANGDVRKGNVTRTLCETTITSLQVCNCVTKGVRLLINAQPGCEPHCRAVAV